MRMRLIPGTFTFYLLLGVLFSFFASGKPASTSRTFFTESKTKQMVNKMLTSIDNIKTLKYSLKVSERISGKMKNTESVIKLQTSPRKLYIYLKGPEVLWVQGKNNGNALVNPAAFPYMNLNLDPYGSLMRKDQHHTIHEIGFSYMGDVLESVMKKVGDKFDKYFAYTGDEKWNSRDCYKIIVSYPDFAYSSYTVKKGENLVTIARKQNVSEYMLLEKNKLSDYNAVKEGQVIQVPNAYGKLVMLYVDKQHNLPVNISIFDDVGLFESYEYRNLQVNPKIADEEFTEDFKDYNF